MDLDYYEQELTNLIGQGSYEKDKRFWIKVYNSAEIHNKLDTLNELIAEVKYKKQTTIIDNPAAYLTTLIKKDIPLEETSMVRFEGNLVENPFYRPGRRSNEPIKFTNTRTDDINKTKVDTEWVLSSESMVPNDEDADVLKVLFQLYHEQGMPISGEVLFTKYDICKRLNKPTSGASYRQITNALKYFFDSKITSKQAFLRFRDNLFLNTDKENQFIRILDTLNLRSSDDDVDGSQELFQSSCILGHMLVENLRLYYSVHIDFDFYIHLRYSMAKRLYEYLQKKRGKDKKQTWKEKLIPLAQKMAMSIKTPRNVKVNLKTALEELKEKEYLVDYLITKEGKVEYLKFMFPEAGKQATLDFNSKKV